MFIGLSAFNITGFNRTFMELKYRMAHSLGSGLRWSGSGSQNPLTKYFYIIVYYIIM